MTLCRKYAAGGTAPEVVKFVLPVIGSVVSGILSYKTTSLCLGSILEEMYEDSVKIKKQISLHLAKTSSV